MSQFSLATIVIISALAITALVRLEEDNLSLAAPRIEAPSFRVGDTVETLIASLGLPDVINYGIDDMTWSYGGESGLQVDIHNDIILGIDGQLPKERARIIPDEERPQLGQRAAKTAQILGNPMKSYSGQFGRQFNYSNGWHVTYRFGRVVACQKGA